MLGSVNNFDQISGEEQVKVFLAALASGQGAESQPLGQEFIHTYGPALRQNISDLVEVSDDDLLIEITRWLLENELENILIQFQRKELKRRELAQLALSFWGVLTVHAEIFLELPLQGTKQLLSVRNGKYIVTMDGLPAYQLQEPLSATRLKSLFSSLGKIWLVGYLGNYCSNSNILDLFRVIGRSQDFLIQWIEDMSFRTLERGRRICYRQLWERQADVAFQIDRPGTSSRYLDISKAIHHRLVLNTAGFQPEDAQGKQSALIHQDNGKLAETLSNPIDSHFIIPDLQVDDEQGHLRPASLEDLAGLQGFNLLVGLPGGGKSRVLAWVARKRLSENRGVSVFLDLVDHMQSGIPSLFDGVAMQMMRSCGSQIGFEELRSYLIEMESRGSLYWQIDHWDRVPENEQERILPSLTRLSHILLSVSDPVNFLDKVQDLHVGCPLKIYHLLPFSSGHQWQYVEQLDLSPAESLQVRERIRQLPGLASLPAGMTAIAQNPSTSIVDILIDYLDVQQRARNNQAVILSFKQTRNTCIVDWHNPQVNAVYEIAAALQKHGPSRQYNLSRLVEMDPILVGAYLHSPPEEMETRIKTAEGLLKTGCEAGLLYRIEKGHYSFVVPEVGYLMAAIAVYSAYEPNIRLKEARDSLALHPQEPLAQVLSALAERLTRSSQPGINRDEYRNPVQGMKDGR